MVSQSTETFSRLHPLDALEYADDLVEISILEDLMKQFMLLDPQQKEVPLFGGAAMTAVDDVVTITSPVAASRQMARLHRPPFPPYLS